MSVSRYLLCCFCLGSTVFSVSCVHTDYRGDTEAQTIEETASKIGDIENEPVTEMAAVIDVQGHAIERNIEIVSMPNPTELNHIEVAAGKEKIDK